MHALHRKHQAIIGLKHPLCWPAFQRVVDGRGTFGVGLNVTGHAVYAAGDARLVGTVEDDGRLVHAGYFDRKVIQDRGVAKTPWTVRFVKLTMMPIEIGSGFASSILTVVVP
jgi:hypothetical protein